MSRTTKTRSTRRYCSPSPSPLRDSDRHYFSSPSPMISLSPVRYKYTYVDTTSHRPGYEAGKVGKGGKGEDYYISSSSPSPSSSSSPSPPLLRRTRSVSILRTGPRPINVQGYDRGYRDGDEDIKAPKRELKTSISYISPRSLSSKIQYSYREDVPYVIYRTSNSGSGEDWYDDARGRVRSGSRSRDERMKGRNIDLNTQHNSKREANVRVSVERERETKYQDWVGDLRISGVEIGTEVREDPDLDPDPNPNQEKKKERTLKRGLDI
ncbi:uncharacterized protein EAE98_007726 [Botrytis deweyae]|uniref:Uncharacterized protein n=1 Tax=Botrytis deweyae TaxID=2478750 RepID=A0ABQ7IFU2_9HELO|nr:uncharacterized protein EAE98_007726 [Botrytis deweyae]KAF7923021.1 hypothetical protein EAE98_007726 [Botrytis deweyae]